jgi:phosphoribosylglycinamide formyltransferase-1
MTKARVLVLISGGGSNLQTLIDSSRTAESSYDIVHVISNRPDAYGLQRAEQAGITARCLDHKAFKERGLFDTALAQMIDEVSPDLIVYAGFMRIMGADFVSRYEGRMINIHPSLLPNFPGLQTHARALEAGVTIHGCTVHWVTEELDGGGIISQLSTDIRPSDTLETLKKRINTLEQQLYPEALRLALMGRD